MQRILLETVVNTPFHNVVERFDDQLFAALAPRFPPMRLLRHDPIADGGEVHLLLNPGPFQQKWISVLSQVTHAENTFSFQDAGIQLPFPLRRWQHIHKVAATDHATKAIIIDDIRFSTGWKLLDWLAKPVLFWLFSQRKPKYVAYFEQCD